MRYKLLLAMLRLFHRLRHHSGRITVRALFVLAALALVTQASVPAHVHTDGDPGIYNAQCPLAALATIQREGPPSAVSLAVSAILVAPLLLFSPTTHTPDAPLDLAAPRAPPLA